MRILVVDDDDDVRNLVVLALSGMTDHEVVGEAATVSEAVAQAGALRPDVVVTDLVHGSEGSMPLLRQLRLAAPQARLVVFSGMARRADAAPFPDADGYVVKGGRIDGLLDAIARVGDGPA
jgi:DNA-binding NarL/FixJ family response regulator